MKLRLVSKSAVMAVAVICFSSQAYAIKGYGDGSIGKRPDGSFGPQRTPIESTCSAIYQEDVAACVAQYNIFDYANYFDPLYWLDIHDVPASLYESCMDAASDRRDKCEAVAPLPKYEEPDDGYSGVYYRWEDQWE